MAQLTFKGKQFVQNYHLGVKFHELVPNKKLSETKKIGIEDNLIIHGDNLIALKALLPTYGGKVKCIYIDPPYNTGNEGWVYNDNVNSPMMKDWLGKVVDKEDLTRHDKWLCMMTPRLKVLRELLCDDGVIFISIGDDEVGNLLSLVDEIFGFEFRVGIFSWKSRTKPTNAGNAKYRPQKVAEYVLAYSKKNPEEVLFNLESENERKYPFKDKIGNYRTTTILTSNRGMFQRETMRFSLAGFKPTDEQRWKAGEDEIKQLYKDKRIDFRDGVPYLKKYDTDEDELLYPLYTYMDEDLTGTAEIGKSELNAVLGVYHGLDTVKPLGLVEYLISIITKGNDIVLDSFAGSGTTAHAVLALNNEDGGNRKFILVECEDYAKTITAERVRKVINGVKSAKEEQLKKGFGGSFSYYELGKPVDYDGILSGKKLPSYKDLARYVFYTATGEEFDPKNIDEKKNFIGESNHYEVYLIYKPEIEFLRSSALTLDKAKSLGKYKKKTRLVFAPTKFLDQEHLSAMNIEFAQLPFEIYKIVE